MLDLESPRTEVAKGVPSPSISDGVGPPVASRPNEAAAS